MGVSEALHITQANISRQALHRRVKRARDKVREKEDAEQAATSLLSLGSSKNPRNKANTLSPPPPKGGLSIITPGPSARKARKATTTTAASSVTLGTRKSPYSTSTTTLNDARSAALDTLPNWVDRETTKAALTKRPKMTRQDRSQRNFDEQSVAKYRWAKYSNAWKAATTQLNNIQKSGKKNT